jgi:hypothetical protein
VSFALVFAELVFAGCVWHGSVLNVGLLTDGRLLRVAPGDGAVVREALALAARWRAEFVVLVPVPAAVPPATAGFSLARLAGAAAEFPLAGGVLAIELELVPTDGDGGGVVL